MEPVESLVRTPIAFAHTGDGERPYVAIVAGVTLLLQVNDFPAEPLYSLYADGEHLADLNDWPAAWLRPGIPSALRDLAVRTPRGAALIAVASPLDAAALRTWATTLCTTPATDSASVLRALRFDGPLVLLDGPLVLLDGPPISLDGSVADGTVDGVGGGVVHRRLALPPAQTVRTDVSERGGELFELRFEPGKIPVTRAELDAEFGNGQASAHRVRYPVVVSEAPFTCDVLISRHSTEITLRRRRVSFQ